MATLHPALRSLTSLVLAACFGVVSSKAAESLSYNSHVWRTEDGLPHNSVNALAQSPEGYLWLGTRRGLARFDGVHFTILPGLENLSITALCQGRDGTLWIGTGGQGLKRYRGGKIEDIKQDDSADNVILSLRAAQEGTIWVGTTQGLSCVRDDSCHKCLDYNRHPVRAMAEEDSGQLWLAVGDGPRRFLANEITNLAVANALFGRAVCFTEKTNLWVGTSLGLTSVAEPESSYFKVWVESSGDLDSFAKPSVSFYNKRNGLAGNTINCLCSDQEENLWIGSDGGLNCLTRDGEALEVQHEGESLDLVYSLLQDREQNIWAGTRDGLYRINRKSFLAYTKLQGLSQNNVTSVLEGAAGRIWIGTLGGGLHYMEDGVITRLALTNCPDYVKYFNNQVLALHYCAPSNVLWFGTDFNGGMFRYEDGELFHYWKGQGTSTLTDPGVRVIFEDPAKRKLWVGTRDALDVAFRNHPFVRYNALNGLAGNSVNAIAKDSQGDIWVGTDNGLSRFGGQNIINYTTKDGLSHNNITALYQDSSNVLWIGTAGGGLNRFADGHFRFYNMRQGLFSDEIFEILEDDADRLWMTCGSGIFWVARKDFAALDVGVVSTVPCVAYGKEDGLASATCNSAAKPAACKSRDGRLWFATIKGLAVVNPASIPPAATRPPPVVIEEVISDGKIIAPADLMSLPPGRGDLEFRFTALSLRAPERNRFKYQLQSVDPDWVEAGTMRFARYNNIYPGRYHFRVAACNCDGVWNEGGATLDFIILPHFWQRSSFKAGVVAGAALLGIFLYKFGLDRFKDMERLRVRIAADLHDEVGSSLGRISLLCQKFQKETPLTEEQRNDLASIKRISTQSANSIRDIVWFINPEYDTMEDLLLRMKDAAHTMLGGMQIQFTGPRDGLRRELSLDFRRNIFRMFKEILGNVASHSQASAVQISMVENAGGWHLMVKDNGIGFDAAAIRPGNGLVNLKKRAENLHGRLDIASCPGAGTTVSFFVDHL